MAPLTLEPSSENRNVIEAASCARVAGPGWLHSCAADPAVRTGTHRLSGIPRERRRPSPAPPWRARRSSRPDVLLYTKRRHMIRSGTQAIVGGKTVNTSYRRAAVPVLLGGAGYLPAPVRDEHPMNRKIL
jgi:hypothetical protein